MERLDALAEILTSSLKLTEPPIAICFTSEVPPGVKMWPGSSPAGCRFWQEAAKGVFATVAGDHALCSIGQYTHNLDMTPAATNDLGDALEVFGQLGYVREADIPQIPILAKRPDFVVYGPLADVPRDPDVILLFVRADQTLILSEASQQLENGLPPAMGRAACAVIPQAVNSGRTALSLGCCGARAYLDILTSEVALYAIPGPSLSAFTELVAALANANTILTKFHEIRRRDIEAGARPSIQESLALMQAGG